MDEKKDVATELKAIEQEKELKKEIVLSAVLRGDGQISFSVPNDPRIATWLLKLLDDAVDMKLHAGIKPVQPKILPVSHL